MREVETETAKTAAVAPPQGAVAFTPERLERFKKLVAKYEVPASAMLPTMYLAQEQWGYLTPPVLDYVASLCGVPSRQAYECASFYTMFKRKPSGKYFIEVCNNITCTMLGSEELLAVLKEELGLEPGQVTADGQIGCRTVECLGSCDTAPVCIFNDEYVENLDKEKFRAMVRSLKSGDPKPFLDAQNR
jgi:NADH-quinone oxidoreductase subunit E